MDPRQDKNRSDDVTTFIHQIFCPTGREQDEIVRSIEDQICTDIEKLLQENDGCGFVPFDELQQKFTDCVIPKESTQVSKHFEEILQDLIPCAINTYSPRFVGHMTSALPGFMMPLAKIMVKLNQNVVKIETSGVFTPLERQLICQMHNLIFACDNNFYRDFIHRKDNCLGSFCSGGTVANLTALWYARNSKFIDLAEGSLRQLGLFQAMQMQGYQGLAILVSEKGHYSLKKASDVLGLGADFLISIPVDENHKVRLDRMEEKCRELNAANIGIVAIVGIAGTTETGNVDDLDGLADIAQNYHSHFHVDAAWGGATLFSDKYRSLLKGIERADSVTIDAHKQMYTPMGVGMVLFKEPIIGSLIQYNAEYIIREGSADLGRHSLEGSRPAMSLFLYSSLKIIGQQGYEFLINRSIEMARTFASLIDMNEDFELITEPELCILTYRYVPNHISRFLLDCDAQKWYQVNTVLNQLTVEIQERLCSSGRSFVSRTILSNTRYTDQKICVFRVVLANPLTSNNNLHEILEEQRLIGREVESRWLDDLI